MIIGFQEDEERLRREAAEEERRKWKVDEQASAQDVMERKKQFLEQNKKPGSGIEAMKWLKMGLGGNWRMMLACALIYNYKCIHIAEIKKKTQLKGMINMFMYKIL